MDKVEVKTIADIIWNELPSPCTRTLYSKETLSHYKHVDILTISNPEGYIAFWPLPYVYEGTHKVIKREIRLLPYHPPVLLKHHPLENRGLLVSLLNFVRKNYFAIDLPLSPDFHFAIPFSGLGMHVEWRNTYRFTSAHPLRDHINRKGKNHIRSAEKTVQISLSSDPEFFDFKLGIVTKNDSQRKVRSQMAKDLLRRGNGLIVTAHENSAICGQALILFDHHSAYLFHTWFNKQGVRGVPSALIDQASNWTLNEKKLPYFDLEGSILPAVDRFFAGLGGIQSPYPNILWCQDRKEMLKRIEENIFLEEKLFRLLS